MASVNCPNGEAYNNNTNDDNDNDNNVGVLTHLRGPLALPLGEVQPAQPDALVLRRRLLRRRLPGGRGSIQSIASVNCPY